MNERVCPSIRCQREYSNIHGLPHADVIQRGLEVDGLPISSAVARLRLDLHGTLPERSVTVAVGSACRASVLSLLTNGLGSADQRGPSLVLRSMCPRKDCVAVLSFDTQCTQGVGGNIHRQSWCMCDVESEMFVIAGARSLDMIRVKLTAVLLARLDRKSTRLNSSHT